MEKKTYKPLLTINNIYSTSPLIFDVLPILIAVRDNNTVVIDNNGDTHNIEYFLKSPDKIYTFIKETGLINLFKDKKIKNLVDYVLGIEVGLDTNARKK